MPETVPTIEVATEEPVGLSEAEAVARLRAEGFNELPHSEARAVWRIAADVVREPMVSLLLAAALIYLLLGSRLEAAILSAFTSVSIAIAIIQEARSESVLESLRRMTSPRAWVIRDGVRRRIEGREVARGDLIALEEGGRVAADARLLRCHDLQADESLLTGESAPVNKALTLDDKVWGGALIVRGGGLARVTATGLNSQIGQIGRSLGALVREPPRLRRETRRLVRIFGLLAAGVCAAVFVAYGLLRGDWLAAALGGVALGMSMIPEEFPLVLSIFTAMGAWRMSRARVLTRDAAAIETLGAASVLCSDKTGTMTQNRMSVVEMRLPDDRIWRSAASPDGEAFLNLALNGVLASESQPFDPMETAFHTLAGRMGLQNDRDLVRAYGLRPDLMAMTQVWKNADETPRIAAKGAPEAICDLCGLDDAQRDKVMRAVDLMARDGMRVLAIAGARHDGLLPESQRGFTFAYLGLAGLADPLREDVPASVRACNAAGVRVVMISGDYPLTAASIARQAGLPCETVISGDMMQAMDDAALAKAARDCCVFARITPLQKLRIVEALKKDGEIVAMTGDGVNDAPSLKAAHIGVAMGGRGSDVAREAAALVLLDDNFSAIVTAIRLGRTIHDNLRKAMCFIVSVHVPIAGMALLPLLSGLPVILGPLHIALLELIIDPACSLVFESEAPEANVMRRKPARADAPLLPGRLLLWGLAQGLVGFAVLAAIFVLGLQWLDASQARMLVFCSLTLVLVSLVLVNRSYEGSLVAAVRKPGRALVLLVLGVAVSLTLILTTPWLRALLDMTPPQLVALSPAPLAAVIVVTVLEALKPFWRRAFAR
ncbi:MAG TPA: cation-translocating P-type ATPase [Asticcacaulis sp.]|nr:cation-translocating P-type ATPase [Asticcacaulis sp.]